MAKAIAKYIRMSPRKLRRVVDVIRGKNAGDAQTTLKFMPYAAARVVEKVLKSAVANAKQNEKADHNDLSILQAYVDQASTLRRWRAVSRGRGHLILKRTSHVTIEVGEKGSLSTKPFKKTKQAEKIKQDHVHGENCDHDHEEHDHEKEDIKAKASPKPKKTATKTKKAEAKKQSEKGSISKKSKKKEDKE